MKNIIRMVNILLAVCMLFSSCGRKSNLASDDTLPDTTVEVKDTTAEDTTAEDTTAEDTTAEDTTEADTTVAVPNDGKVHVDSIKLDKYTVTVKVGESDMPWVTMLPENAPDKSEIWKSSDTKIATVNTYGKITGVSEGECTVTVTSADNENVSATVKVTVKRAVKEVTYIDGILIANKTYALPSNYNPGVDAQANNALNEMINAAKTEGVVLRMISGFRSYSTQNTLYNNYVARDGKAEADRYSARPGHSEHQTGLAFDLNSLEQSFENTKEGKWLAENCWKYGFIIRYPKGKESVTGYMFEPWHVRYLGKEVAKKVYESGKCLEEYLGITSVYEN
jgi:D-alanyl-D-alanine carboxypeptidase